MTIITCKIICERTSSVNMLIEKLEYQIQTLVQESETSEKESTVVFRSYSDFMWLQDQLRKRYPGHMLPNLPCKTLLAKLSKNLGNI